MMIRWMQTLLSWISYSRRKCRLKTSEYTNKLITDIKSSVKVTKHEHRE